MYEPSDPVLLRLKAKLLGASWDKRVAEARVHAAVCERLLTLVEGGTTLGTAIRAHGGGEPDATWRARLGRFRAGGVEGLIDRRYLAGEEKVTPEIEAFVRGLKHANPDLTSEKVAAAVSAHTGVPIAASTLRPFLKRAGLARREGRPSGRPPIVEPLALAGAELLKAAAIHTGVVRRLTDEVSAALARLPAPAPESVRDDRANRDPNGRFLSGYNADQGRGDGELGPRFRSAEEHRNEKDLPAMQVVRLSKEILHRKLLAMVLLPCVIPSPRWEALSHWQGDLLGPLVGFPYQPETLGKFLRELKHAGMAGPLRDAVARYWLGREARAGNLVGAILLYGDTSTKPVWTHHFSRCVPVAKLGGRIMPATSTISLHTGCGTPVIYRSFSGHVSLPQQVPALLREFEAIAGPGSAERVIVMDRESHSIALFKELAAAGWCYIVPLCTSVTGPKATFDSVSAWEPYRDTGDEVCEGRILLRDSRTQEEDEWVRAVARRRRRTGKVAWYATNTRKVLFDAPTVIERYFARWPLQEHVFREGTGRIGLDVHHGFGRIKIQNVAVVGAIERLDGRLHALDASLATAKAAQERVGEDGDRWGAVHGRMVAHRNALRAAFDEVMSEGRGNTPEARETHESVRAADEWLDAQVPQLKKQAAAEQKVERRVGRLLAAQTRANEERTGLERRREVYTIDVELDEVMTAFKLTFMNLAMYFVREFLGKEPVELETLIQAVFSLPGERIRTKHTETIRIWRQPRERRFMPLVEKACEKLSALKLTSAKRRLRFELVDKSDTNAPRAREAATT